MNRVITINLNGNAYTLEEQAYDVLRNYLAAAERALAGNPDKEEIIADIEQAVAERCRALLSPHRTVIAEKDMRAIVEAMGPVSAEASDTGAETETPRGSSAENPGTASAGASGAAPKRLYRLRDGAMISGVCAGLGAYFDIDPTLVRIAFAVLAPFFGVTFLVYLFMLFLIPEAKTVEEKAAAHAGPVRAADFIKRAKAGYYEGTKNWRDKESRRAWKQKFKSEMREWKRNFRQQMRDQGCAGHGNWVPPIPPGNGSFLLYSVVSFLKALLGVCFALALLSFLLTHTVFGIPFPAGVNLFGGVLILILVFVLLSLPLKMLKRSIMHAARGTSFWHYSLYGLFDFLMSLVVMVFALWLANRYIPFAHEILVSLKQAFLEVARGLGV